MEWRAPLLAGSTATAVAVRSQISPDWTHPILPAASDSQSYEGTWRNLVEPCRAARPEHWMLGFGALIFNCIIKILSFRNIK
jgi:hypothetical protein